MENKKPEGNSTPSLHIFAISKVEISLL